jgi:hypothetical protein
MWLNVSAAATELESTFQPSVLGAGGRYFAAIGDSTGCDKMPGQKHLAGA